ncbi:MAG: S24/S26 family peptidase [Thermodesulfobacteriota bacterium]|nr:S24/S26 family peptidase [Thermodesulfobacteriota bacterium]
MVVKKASQQHIAPVMEIWKEKDRSLGLTVYGDSMRPLINPGDRISLRLMDAVLLKRGDIIAFREGNHLVVHRFIRKKMVNGTWMFCQKGDNLRGWSWLQEDRIVGKVESIRRQGRILCLERWYWLCINQMLGLAYFAWIVGYEKARGVKIFIFGSGPIWLLSRIGRRHRHKKE